MTVTIEQRDVPVLVMILLAGPADVALSLPHWHLETNPVALALGPAALVAVKTAALVGVAWLWFYDDVHESRAARACVWGLLVLYALVVLGNVAVLTGVLAP